MEQAKTLFWLEVRTAADASGMSTDDVVFQMVTQARRDRDNAILALKDARETLETHREYWKRSRLELEDAKLLADQAHNRARRLQSKERRGKFRREVDEENATIRRNLELAIRAVGHPSNPEGFAISNVLRSLFTKARSESQADGAS